MNTARIAELRKQAAVLGGRHAFDTQFMFNLTPAELNDLLDAYVKLQSEGRKHDR